MLSPGPHCLRLCGAFLFVGGFVDGYAEAAFGIYGRITERKIEAELRALFEVEAPT